VGLLTAKFWLVTDVLFVLAMVPYIPILKETETMFVHSHFCQLSC